MTALHDNPNSYHLYSNLETRDTILECWEASTKHPDCIFRFSDFALSNWAAPQSQVVPWLLECASKLNWPYHSYQLARWACDIFESWW